MSSPKSKDTEQVGEQLSYSQEYYILHREELMEKRKQKEAEAKFGDFSARLVKRPQKNFLWGYGTQVYDDTRSKYPFIYACRLFQEGRAADHPRNHQVPRGLPDERNLSSKLKGAGSHALRELRGSKLGLLGKAPVQHSEGALPGGESAGVPGDCKLAEGPRKEGRFLGHGCCQGNTGAPYFGRVPD